MNIARESRRVLETFRMDESCGSRKDRLHAVLPVLLVSALLVPALLTGLAQEEPDTDEYLYMNMAGAVLDGSVPYRDFFSAHMPGVFLPATGLFAVFGKDIAVARAIPALSTCLIFVFTWLIARKVWKDSVYPAVFALTFLVTSVNMHAVSASFIGVNLAAALTLAGVFCHYSNRPAVSGLLLASSLLVRLGSAPVFLLFAVLSADRKRFLAGSALPLAAMVSLLFIPNFLEQTFWYHIDKTGIGIEDRFAQVWSFLWAEKFLFLFSAAALILLRGEKTHRPVMIAAGLIIAFGVIQKVVWTYYFNPAIPLLALAAGGAVWGLLRNRIRPELMFLPNLGLMALVGVVNVLPIMRTYRDDRSLDPVLSRVSAECGGASGHFLDLTGGTLGAYVSMKTGIPQTGRYFDFNSQRIVTDDADKVVGEVVGLIDQKPGLIVTEIEAGKKTVIWSKMKTVRAMLNRKYHLEDYLFQQNKGRIIEFWLPSSGKPPVVDLGKVEPKPVIFRVAVVLGSGKVKTYDERAKWGMETDALARFLNDCSPGQKLMSDFAFADASTELLIPEDDLAEKQVVTLRWVSSVQKEGSVRMLLENFKDSEIFEPVSFVEAVFESPGGTLKHCTMFTEFEDRLYPTVRIWRMP